MTADGAAVLNANFQAPNIDKRYNNLPLERIYYLQFNMHNHMHCMRSKYTLLAQMIRRYLQTIP